MKENHGKVGILGYGQVGKAIAKLTKPYYLTLVKDINFDHLKNQSIDILHICIPYSDKFERVVVNQIKLNRPSLVVINSTVKPGTTKSIYEETKIKIVHSPVMGVHPRLYYYLFQFPKFIGPVNKKSGELASNHIKTMGLKTIIFNNPEETELAKLLDTTYYGLNIVFCKWVKEICEKKGLDFGNVYTKLNRAYNEGYYKTLPNVRRPILKPIPGRIGGSCIVPNANLLNKYISNEISKLINETK